MKLEQNKVYCGDCLDLMKQIPSNSVDCIITSPPYWALRDYGSSKQIGQEKNPSEYIDKIIEIMGEAKRVIKPKGTIFLNLGDSFHKKSISIKNSWLVHKQKLLIPYRIAIRCQEELGLILRNDIHWVKKLVNVKKRESIGNAVPSPVQDRFATYSESIFFFVKSPEYFFNLDAVRIPAKIQNVKGVNPGDCLRFPFEPSRENHFAMFPSTIPEFFIKCGCPRNGLVLDPFMGSGTTALAAKKLGKNFLGFEVNQTYCNIIKRRLSKCKI